MNQGVQFNGVMAGASTKQDGSLGIRLETAEMTSEDCLAIFSLRNIPCLVTLKPNDIDAMSPKEIKGELSKRTQSERIRSALFVWWHQLGEPGQFEVFYRSETEKYLNQLKSHLKSV